jgi:hypothetical protein
MPFTVTRGAVLLGAGAVTLTVKVAGAGLNESPVSLLDWLTLIVVEPTLFGVTVSICAKPQLVKVTEDGLTVATEVSLELTDTTRGLSL